MSEDKPSTWGGPGRGGGRKPGTPGGNRGGGRPISTRTIRRGEPVFVFFQNAEEQATNPPEKWVAVEMDRTKIVFRSEQTGDRITMRC